MSDPDDRHGPEQARQNPHQGSRHRPQSPNGAQYAGPNARNRTSSRSRASRTQPRSAASRGCRAPPKPL
jgi:hypothetical protein